MPVLCFRLLAGVSVRILFFLLEMPERFQCDHGKHHCRATIYLYLKNPCFCLPSLCCTQIVLSLEQTLTTTYPIVYIFVGSVIMGPYWYHIVCGAIITFVGFAYCALEFIPSIEPPANMRYVYTPPNSNKVDVGVDED